MPAAMATAQLLTTVDVGANHAKQAHGKGNVQQGNKVQAMSGGMPKGAVLTSFAYCLFIYFIYFMGTRRKMGGHV